MDIDQVKILDVLDEHIDERPSIQIKQTSQSKFKDQYLANLPALSESSEKQLRDTLIDKLCQCKIQFHQTSQEPDFRIIINEYLPNKQIIYAQVFLRNFTIPLLILNMSEESKNHQIKESFSGNFAKTYKSNIDKNMFAIKCHCFKGSPEKTLKNVIKEYCICRIASALEVGPFIASPFGFDIIIYQKCIQFIMEFCEQGFACNSTVSEDLLSALRKIHLFKLMHLDIKPDNICFSSTFNRYIFIDFGLGKVINQEIGESTLTNFVGTLDFCSEQMRECYITHSQRHIDLYYNDYICLKQSFMRIKQQMMYEQFEEHIQKMYKPVKDNFNLFETNILTICKYHIFFIGSQQNFKLLNNIFQYHSAMILQRHQNKLKTFIRNVGRTVNLSKLYQKYIKLTIAEQARDKFFQFHLQNIYKKAPKQKDKQEDSFYVKQFNLLMSINNQDEQISWNTEMENHLIVDSIKVAKHKKEEYFLIMANVLQVNCTNHEYQTKVKACSIMKTVYPTELSSKERQEGDLLSTCIQFLFDYGFQAPTTRIKIEIIFKMIVSVIILELKSQSQLIGYFENVIGLQSEINSKLKLMLQFISSVQWIYQKYKTMYNARNLQASLLSLTSQYLSRSYPDSSFSKNIFVHYLKQVVLHRQQRISIKYLDHLIYSFFSYQSRLLEQVDKQIYTDLQVYLLTTLLRFYLQEQLGEQHSRLVKGLEAHVRTNNIKMIFKFESYYFLLFQEYVRSRFNKIYSMIYTQFHNIFKNYPKINYFKIEIAYKYHSIFQFLKLNEDIFNDSIFQKITTCKDQDIVTCLSYISMFFDLFYLLSSQKQNSIIKNTKYSQFTSYIKQFIQPNRFHTLMQGMHREDTIQLTIRHKHQRRKDILNFVNFFISIYKVSGKIYTQQFDEVLQNFIEAIQTIIQNQKCFKCKFQSLVKSIPLRILKLQRLKLYDQIVNIYLQMSGVCLKQKRLFQETVVFITQITNFCRIKSLLFKYQPYLYQYEITKILKTERLLMSGDVGDNKLQYLYNYFYQTRQFDKIYQMINSLLELLFVTENSHIYLSNFHDRIVDVVGQHTEKNKKTNIFFNNHAQVIERFMGSTNGYVGLYFSALIYSCSNVPKNKFIMKICTSLNTLDQFSKKLVLDDLYKVLLIIYALSARKQKYFKAKYFKHTLSNKQMIQILKSRMPNRKKMSRIHRSQLEYKLGKYYDNLEILQQKKQFIIQ